MIRGDRDASIRTGVCRPAPCDVRTNITLPPPATGRLRLIAHARLCGSTGRKYLMGWNRLNQLTRAAGVFAVACGFNLLSQPASAQVVFSTPLANSFVEARIGVSGTQDGVNGAGRFI